MKRTILRHQRELTLQQATLTLARGDIPQALSQTGTDDLNS
jgi:hypothetical protein